VPPPPHRQRRRRASTQMVTLSSRRLTRPPRLSLPRLDESVDDRLHPDRTGGEFEQWPGKSLRSRQLGNPLLRHSQQRCNLSDAHHLGIERFGVPALEFLVRIHLDSDKSTTSEVRRDHGGNNLSLRDPKSSFRRPCFDCDPDVQSARSERGHRRKGFERRKQLVDLISDLIADDYALELEIDVPSCHGPSPSSGTNPAWR